MRSFFYAIFTTYLISAHSGVVSADAQNLISLPQAVAASVQSSPNVALIDRELASRVADALAVEARLNPEVESFIRYGFERERAGFEVELGVPFRWSDFGARAVYGAAFRAAGNIEQKAALFALSAETASLYVSVWAAQERARLAQQAATQALAIETEVRRLERDPRRTVSELRLFGGEAERQRLRFDSLETERLNLAAQLSLTTALPIESAELTVPFSAAVPALAATLALARETDWTRRTAEASLRLADRRLEVARRDSGLTITPRLRYERTVEGDDEVAVGVALPFPLFDRNQAEITRALADQRAAAIQIRFIDERGLETSVRAAHQRSTRYEAAARMYRETVIPAFESNLALVRRQFERGQASLLEIWQLQQSLIDVRREALEAQISAFEARVELHRAVGTIFEETAP